MKIAVLSELPRGIWWRLAGDNTKFGMDPCRDRKDACPARRLLGSAMGWLLLLAALVARGQQPVIDDFTPQVGTAGDQLLVTGTGFSGGGTRVYFWRGVEASVTVRSDSTMDVIVPAGATSGPLGVQRNFGGTNYTAADFTRIGSGPHIAGILPMYGPTNELVEITGVHFAGLAADGVRFNGKRAVDASVNSAGTYISVHVPYGATSGFISVATPLGTSNSPAPFTVLGPGPFITGFSPSHGMPGTRVLIEGVQFGSATNVGFSGVLGGNFAVQSATLIRVDVPAGAVSGPITVFSPKGNSTSAGDFLVPPAITNVTPAGGRAGTNVAIRGRNFRGATGVTFNGLAATYNVVSNNLIEATVPAGATTGPLRVTTPFYSTFAPNDFVVRPTIHGFAPIAGPVGTSVVITGANFNVGTPVVRFHGVQAAAPTGVSFGQLTAKVPAGTTTGRISVSTADGSHTNAANFFLPPSITGFSPTNSAPGTSVAITGLNLLGATSVSFNGAPSAAFTVNNNTSITATVPEGVTSGPLAVQTPAGTATSARLFYGAPIISGFIPVQGLPGTNVTVSGTNFLGARAVRFNGIAGTMSLVENGRIIATVPQGAQSGPIAVEAPAGTNTTATNFVVEYSSNLEVWMTNSPTAVNVGDQVLFAVTMINRGPFNASNARWTNTFPDSVIDSVQVGPPWTGTTFGATIVATCGVASAGGSSTMLVRVRPQTPGDMVASASIASDNPDPLPENNSYTLTTRVDPLPILTIRWWTNQVRVGWPVGLSEYLLEANTDLYITNTWQEITNVPLVSGNEQFITESNSGPMKFYRLKK